MKHEKVHNLLTEAQKTITRAATTAELEASRIKYLGRNGSMAQLLKDIPTLLSTDRASFGQEINTVKTSIERSLKEQEAKLRHSEIAKLKTAWLDVTAPGVKPPLGHLHLITQAIREITSIFAKLGFVRVGYPEVDYDWYAFEGLNMPKNHPARDEWETFFVDLPAHKKYGDVVLTPHTSNGQLREMERVRQTLPAGRQAPIRMINIAKCFRRQSDVSHAPIFHQFEGLLVDHDISIPDLKGTLDFFAREYFGKDRKTRIRPFHFQFTEPSFEVDVSCDLCQDKGLPAGRQGCRMCKEGWLEIGGCGMVHPTVLANGGVDSSKYSGFAFGWGVERVLLMKSGLNLPDLRMLYSTDVRFLQQF